MHIKTITIELEREKIRKILLSLESKLGFNHERRKEDKELHEFYLILRTTIGY